MSSATGPKHKHTTIVNLRERERDRPKLDSSAVFVPALQEVGGSLCKSLSSFTILFEAIRAICAHKLRDPRGRIGKQKEEKQPLKICQIEGVGI